ncbi:MAG: 1-acyl-sn-glycerol-3-phosphate acyltransferase [Vicinamibacterales bacterium]|nr:1-acyl-sn-glycerol-3-phosphate acyltransferase [Vicinamibacterales bacterium]
MSTSPTDRTAPGGPGLPSWDLQRRERLEAHYATTPFVREVCLLSSRPEDGTATARLDNGPEQGPHALVVADADYLRRRRIAGVSDWIRFELETLSAALPPHERLRACHITLEPLPRSPDGRLDRDAAERRSHRAPLASAPSPPANGVERQVLDIVTRTAGRPAWPGAHLDLDLGLDSLGRAELLFSIERESGTRLDERLAPAAATVRDLVDAVLASTEAGGPAEADPWAAALGVGASAEGSLAAPAPRPLVGGVLGYLLLKTGLAAARVGLRLDVQGLEHLPRRGPYLICPNHQTLADGFLISAVVPYRTWQDLFFVGASEYYATRGSAWFARAIRIVPIDADGNLAGAMRIAADGLRRGRVLLLFPEGERSIDGELKRFRRGGAILASRLGIPVVPLAITGAFPRWPRGHAFAWRRFLGRGHPPVRLRFGAPMLPGVGGVPAGDHELARAIRDRVAALAG